MYSLIKAGYYDYTYTNVSLPPWSQRDDQIYHCLALELKAKKTMLRGTKCKAHHSRANHSTPHGMLRTMNAKARAGGHCPLYDAFEVFAFRGGEYIL